MTDYEQYLLDELIEEYEREDPESNDYGELFARLNNLSHLPEVKPYLYTMRFFGLGTHEDHEGVISELRAEKAESNYIFRGLLNDFLLFDDESNSLLREELREAEELGYSDKYLKYKSHLHEKNSPVSDKKVQTDNPSGNMVRLGVMHLRSGDRKKATRQFEAALQADTKCVGAYLGLICSAENAEVKPYCQQLTMFSIDEISAWLNEFPDLVSCANQFGYYIDRLITNGSDEKAIAALLEAGISPSGVTLYQAIKAKYSKELIRALLDKGANANAAVQHKFESGYAEELFPLTAAVNDAKDIETVRLLIDRGANAACVVRDTDGNMFPLINDAVRDNNYELVELLLNAGANPNAGQITLNRSNYGMGNEFSALQEAIVHNCDLRIIESLLKHGANPNYNSYARAASGKRKIGNGICDAIWYSETPADVVKLLLEFGANPRSVWTDFCPVGVGYFPQNASLSRGDYFLCTIPVLALALINNQADVAQLLLAAGANINDKCAIKNEQGYESRYCTIAQCSSDLQRSPEIMYFLRQMFQPAQKEAPRKQSWLTKMFSLEEKSPLEQTIYYFDTAPSEDPYDLVYHWV